MALRKMPKGLQELFATYSGQKQPQPIANKQIGSQQQTFNVYRDNYSPKPVFDTTNMLTAKNLTNKLEDFYKKGGTKT